MSQNRLVFSGLDELKAELRRLPAALTDEASSIVFDAANGAADVIAAVYNQHDKSGNLSAGLSVKVEPGGAFGAKVVVKSASRHAWLFDNGSQARHRLSGGSTGVMGSHTPPTHIFIQSMMRQRRAMYEQLRALLERHGLTVSGNA